MKLLVLFPLIFWNFLTTEGNFYVESNNANNECRIDSLLQRLGNPDDSYVMVVAHRGDWTNAPENSLLAITNAIEAGADIVEIDVRMTKDKALVLMHDRTIDRTTTGKGKLNKWTLDSLKTLYLRDSKGIPTPYRIPTLEEALLLTRGKVLVNLDKCSMHINRIVKILNKTRTLNQAIFKRRKEFHKIRLHKKCSKKKLIYIPKIKEKTRHTELRASNFIKKHKPVAFDINFTNEDSIMFPLIKAIKKNSCRIWTSTTTQEAILINNENQDLIRPDKTWGWAINRGANIILTDRPGQLIEYLKEKGLRKKNNLDLKAIRQ